MENKKKKLIFVLFIGLLACNNISNKTITHFRVIKENLLVDDKNNVYLVLEHNYFHPKELNKTYDTIDFVTTFYSDSIIKLKTIIDTSSFKKCSDSKNYFQDKNYLYSNPYIIKAGYKQFYLIDNLSNIKDFRNDTISTKFGIFYRGVLVKRY